MKKIYLAVLVTLTLSYLSCKKSDQGSTEIYGTWKLVETWNDPGDGSGKYVKVKGAPKYISIDKSGTIGGDALPDALSYKILDSVQMEITSNNYAKPFVYRYKVSSNTLELNPPCIEGCGLKFKR